MKQIQRMKKLNGLLTTIFVLAGISCIVLEILQWFDYVQTNIQDVIIISVGLGLLVVSWIVHVVHSFFIEWAENTYAVRMALQENSRKSTDSSAISMNVPWVSSNAFRISDEPISHSEPIMPKSNLDMQLVQDVIHSHSSASRANASSNQTELTFAFDQALQKLSTGAAVENEKYKLQKHQDGKIIIGTKSLGNDFRFEYLQNSKAIPELHQLKWQTAEKEMYIKWM